MCPPSEDARPFSGITPARPARRELNSLKRHGLMAKDKIIIIRTYYNPHFTFILAPASFLLNSIGPSTSVYMH
jgi:hypothetical protein